MSNANRSAHTKDLLKPQPIDTLIQAPWMIPVIPDQKVYENCALAIHAGKILALLPADEADQRFVAKEKIQLAADQVLIPGLVNTHTHGAMSLLRGYADDLPLMEWLQQQIWPAEKRWLSAEFVADGSRLAMAEMLRSGTTTFSDQYFFPEAIVSAARDVGIRAQIAFPVLDASNAWAHNADAALEKGLALRDTYRSHERISLAFAPHAPYTVGDTTLKKIATYAAELQMPIQIHLHETQNEVTQAIAETNMRPTERLQKLGLLTPQTLCVHMTVANATDIKLLQQSGAHVSHCPKSNLKLASGFCPVVQMQEAGINVALGTDGAASNNSLDLFAEANIAALLAKATTGDASALPAHQALAMATICGARALGLEQHIGSLEAGKNADLAAIKLDALEQQPLHNPLSQLIYTASGPNISDVWVAGRRLLKNRILQTLNEQELIHQAQHWRAKMAGRGH
ncbi:MAG: TRZ/ATZ family hydrolase [Gammaproteobacteria bacterium]|nr:TRZ/ATZ family hydrolase [Gammaproteobacteria bacterium]